MESNNTNAFALQPPSQVSPTTIETGSGTGTVPIRVGSSEHGKRQKNRSKRSTTEAAFAVMGLAVNPQVLGASARLLRPLGLAALALLISVTIAGKRRCFCILVAHLQNRSCATSSHPKGLCSISLLNWIGDISAALTFLTTPFVTNVLLSSKRAFGHQIMQFVSVFAFGCVITGFVRDPESLLVTDSVIQGISAGALLSLVTIRVGRVFPPSHRYHVLVTALVEGGPFGTVIFCPLFAVLIQNYDWQVTYSVLAALLLVECFFSSILSGTETSILEPETEPPPDELSDSSDDGELAYMIPESSSDVRTSPCPPSVTSTSTGPYIPPLPPTPPREEPPPPDQIFTGAKMGELCRQPEVVLWCVDRALFFMIMYGVLMNMVDYMTVVVRDSLEQGALITLTFGGGEVVGLLIAVAFGDHLKEKLIYIYTISTVVLFAVLMIWHLLQTHGPSLFTGADVHFMSFVFGWAAVFSSAYGYTLSEELTNMPGQYAYPMTRFAQGIGLLLAPLTSGVLLELMSYSRFFLIQALLCFVRLVIQIIVSFIYSRRRKAEMEALKSLGVRIEK